MDVTNVSKHTNLFFKKSLFDLLIFKICFLHTKLLLPTFSSPYIYFLRFKQEISSPVKH